jgi:hypothetical protein
MASSMAANAEFRGFGLVEQEDTQIFDEFSSGSVDGLEPLNTNAALHLPPVRTRTWFHTGAWIEASALADQFRSEFWPGDPNAFPLRGHDTPDDPEALRALRGAVLRRGGLWTRSAIERNRIKSRQSLHGYREPISREATAGAGRQPARGLSSIESR